jgi:hypothetical protein
MDVKCPLISYGREGVCKQECMGKQCALWDEAVDGCLIRSFLISQIEALPIKIKTEAWEIKNPLREVQTTTPEVGIRF